MRSASIHTLPLRVTIVTAVRGNWISTSGEGARAGTRALMMAADPINRDILRGGLGQPVRAPDGQRFETTPSGREGLFAAFVLERWLQAAPAGPIAFAGEGSEPAVNALVEGWDSSVIHALARRPQTFGELRAAADGLSRRALRRLLSAMRRCGQLEARGSTEAGDAVYGATDWLRGGVAALIAAARIELREPSAGAAPIDALDVEAAFMLALPLLELPQDLARACGSASRWGTIPARRSATRRRRWPASPRKSRPVASSLAPPASTRGRRPGQPARRATGSTP